MTHSTHQTSSDEPETTPRLSGGPLSRIAAQHDRPASERAFARELLTLLSTQRHTHGQALRLGHDSGLSFAQFRLLFHVPANVEPGISLSQLAQHAGVTPATATQAVRQLEQQQLVVRAPHPTDQRIVLIRQTAQGERAVGAAQRVFNESWQEMVGALDEDELATGAVALAHASAMLERLVR